mgnify:CR=1 FL=1
MILDDALKAKIRSSKMVVIGGSAGSFNDMIEWTKVLKGRTVVLVIHRNQQHKSNLVNLMQYFSKLRVKEAEDDEAILSSRLYIAPAGYHLVMLDHRHWKLEDSEPIWFCKPAIDKLFRSVAEHYGEKVTGILLSGANQDGAQGLQQIKEKGGAALCIHPEEAEYRNMPDATRMLNAVDYYYKRDDIPEIAKLFNSLE